MEALKLERKPCGPGMTTVTITGFGEGELAELKRLEHGEAKTRLLEMLDERNGNQGTCFQNGYGVYGVWFDNEAAFINIGNSCD